MANEPEQQKLDQLAAQIREAQGNPVPTENDTLAVIKGRNSGYELVGTILLCTVIGWLIDKYLHTSPWGILVMLVVGFIAGIMNVWRALNGYDQSVGLHKQEKK